MRGTPVFSGTYFPRSSLSNLSHRISHRIVHKWLTCFLSSRCLNKCCDNEGSNDLAYTESSILAEYCSGSPVVAMPTAVATTAAARGGLGTPVETTSGGSVATATSTKKNNAGTNMAPASLVLGGLLSSGLLFIGMWL